MVKLSQDKVLDVLKGSGRGKRAKRFGTMNIFMREHGYLIEFGGRTIVECEAGTREDALADAKVRAAHIVSRTGHPIVIDIY